MSEEEKALEYCYASHPDILAELIGRLREKHTLDALDGLIGHLELLQEHLACLGQG